MKTQKFYQSTKPIKRQPTNIDILKGLGYYGAMFIVSFGLFLLILSGNCVAEFISNLFK
jgi:hypothetical protein